MNVFKPLLKQMLRLYYFVTSPDVIRADPDAIGDPFRREFLKNVKQCMMNGEPLPDIIKVRHTEGYPAVEVDLMTGRTRVTMEEILGSEKIMEHLEALEAKAERKTKEREQRAKSQVGEGNGRSGRKSRARKPISWY